MGWLEQRRNEGDRSEPRSLTLKLVVDGYSAPALKAYVSNFDELGVFPVRTTQGNVLS